MPDLPTRPEIFPARIKTFLELHVNFPDCWDGERLDSPDHHSPWPTAANTSAPPPSGESAADPAAHSLPAHREPWCRARIRRPTHRPRGLHHRLGPASLERSSTTASTTAPATRSEPTSSSRSSRAGRDFGGASTPRARRPAPWLDERALFRTSAVAVLSGDADWAAWGTAVGTLVLAGATSSLALDRPLRTYRRAHAFGGAAPDADPIAAGGSQRASAVRRWPRSEVVGGRAMACEEEGVIYLAIPLRTSERALHAPGLSPRGGIQRACGRGSTWAGATLTRGCRSRPVAVRRPAA